MSNPNGINNKLIEAWCKDYAEMCDKHAIYLVVNDDVWLQSAGEYQDSFEAGQNMLTALLTPSGQPEIGAGSAYAAEPGRLMSDTESSA